MTEILSVVMGKHTGGHALILCTSCKKLMKIKNTSEEIEISHWLHHDQIKY